MKIEFYNLAGTIKSFFQNASTVARTWIFPNKDGTVAMMDDVAAAQSNAQGYADGKVEDAINDGITTKAPSENAVFDALALKEDTANKVTDFSILNNVKFPSTKAVDDMITAKRGAINGLASLDGSGKVPASQIPEIHFRGYYTSLVALQTAIPTGNNGDYATVDAGAGSAAQTYIWDAQDGWTLQSSSGAGVTSFNTRTGSVTSANGDYTAGQVTNVPAGNVAATTVQAAINELDSEKQAISEKDVSGGYVGLTLRKINFKNVLGTFISFFTNSNTAARTYTFQDRDGTIADNTDLAAKVNKTDFVTLTDGATVTWDTSNGAGAGNGEQTPLAKVTLAGTSRTLAMTNLKSGASGLLVITTGVAGAITLTFPSGSVTDNGSLTTYTFPAGSGKAYDLSFWYYQPTNTLKWLIGVSNIDTDQTMAANSDLLVASQRATKAADDANLNTAQSYTDTSIQFIPWKNIVDAATTAALPANTPGSNINGVYQLLTANVNGAWPAVDSYGGGTKFLVQFEADQKKNGKYDLIDSGSGSTPWVLRRSTDFDATNKMRAAVIRVLNGSVNGGKFFKQDTPAPVIGTSNIVFTEFGTSVDDIDFLTFRNFYGY